jgi:hypothetical protein
MADGRRCYSEDRGEKRMSEYIVRETGYPGTIKQEIVGELVRCKDCKHRDPEDKKCDCGHGILWQLPRDDNWFCADGKRGEG